MWEAKSAPYSVDFVSYSSILITYQVHDERYWSFSRALIRPKSKEDSNRIFESERKKKNVFVILIAGEIWFIVELRESILTWEKGVNKITYDLGEWQKLWVKHNGVAKAWLELQLKTLG